MFCKAFVNIFYSLYDSVMKNYGHSKKKRKLKKEVLSVKLQNFENKVV